MCPEKLVPSQEYFQVEVESEAVYMISLVDVRELKKTTFLTTRTLTGNKLHVFNQSQFCFFTS